MPSPDTALVALTWPLAIFGAGLALGLASMALTGNILSVVTSAPAENDKNKGDLLELVNRMLALIEG